MSRQEAVDRCAVHAQDAADPHGVEAAIVNQAANRFRVNAELVRNVANTDEVRLSVDRRHAPKLQQQPANCRTAAAVCRLATATGASAPGEGNKTLTSGLLDLAAVVRAIRPQVQCGQ